MGRLMERMAKSCHALFVASPMAGEGMSLETGQLASAFECAMKSIAARVPLFMWITRRSGGETLETLALLSERLRQTAYPGDVYWVDSPLVHHSNRGLSAYYEEFCSNSDRPVIIFNDPRLVRSIGGPLKRKNIRTSIFEDMARIERVAAMVFKGDLDRVYNYARVAARAKDFPIYEGDEGRFLDRPSLSGVVSAGANLLPEIWASVTTFCLDISGEMTIYPDHLMQIWKMGKTLRELLDTYREHPAAVIKAVLAAKGTIKTALSLSYPRRPMAPMIEKAIEVMNQEDSFN
jgi:dihydrodipicolinate synthase/N-acetylneuraminate lyase